MPNDIRNVLDDMLRTPDPQLSIRIDPPNDNNGAWSIVVEMVGAVAVVPLDALVCGLVGGLTAIGDANGLRHLAETLEYLEETARDAGEVLAGDRAAKPKHEPEKPRLH